MIGPSSSPYDSLLVGHVGRYVASLRVGLRRRRKPERVPGLRVEDPFCLLRGGPVAFIDDQQHPPGPVCFSDEIGKTFAGGVQDADEDPDRRERRQLLASSHERDGGRLEVSAAHLVMPLEHQRDRRHHHYEPQIRLPFVLPACAAASANSVLPPPVATFTVPRPRSSQRGRHSRCQL